MRCCVVNYDRIFFGDYYLATLCSSTGYKIFMDFLGVGTITSRSVIAFSIFNKRFSGFYIDSCKIWLVLLRSSRVEGCPGGLPLIFTPCGDYYKSSASPAKSELRMRPDHGSTIYCCVSLRVPSEFTHDRWSPFSVYCF